MYCDQCGTQLETTVDPCSRCGNAPLASLPARGKAHRMHQWAQSHVPEHRLGYWLLVVPWRSWFGTLVGLFAAWFNLPFIIFMAGLGAVIGGLGGTIAGPGGISRLYALLTWVLPLPVQVEDLLPSAALQVGGLVGGILGAGTGAAQMAWTTWYEFWNMLYQIDPSRPASIALGQIVTAVVVALGYTSYSVLLEGWRLRVAGVRPPSRREAELLAPLVQQAAARMGCRSVPLLRIDDDRRPNARAGARHLVVNRGLLEYLRYDESALAGAIAHEVAHYKHGDAITTAWSKGIALPLYLVHELATRAQGRRLSLLVIIVLWSVTVTVNFVVMPAHAAGARRRERAADNAAKAAGYGEGLYRALSMLGHGFDGARSGWERSILNSHPATELRLNRLEGTGGPYRLPYGSVPPPGRQSQRRGPPKD